MSARLIQFHCIAILLYIATYLRLSHMNIGITTGNLWKHFEESRRLLVACDTGSVSVDMSNQADPKRHP